MNINKKYLGIAAGILSPLAVLAMLHVLFMSIGELWYATVMADAFALSRPALLLVVLPIVVIIVVALVGGALLDNDTAPPAGVALLIGALALLVGSFIPGSPTFSKAARSKYEAQTKYLENLTVTSTAHPEYKVRQNYVQAKRILTETVNDAVVGGFSQLQYTVANGDPAWCAGVLSRKDGKGRQYVQGVRCLTASEDVVKADFKGRVPSINGLYSTNLSKQIAEAMPGMSVDEMDVRYAIVKGKALSVASVTKVVRGMNPHRVPGGVFVFDENGKMTYRASVKAGEFGFAVLPYGIAEQLRKALNTRAGYWCMNHLSKAKCVKQNKPLEDTNHSGGEEGTGNVNAENYSEFVLHRADGSIGMVTPLTSWGVGRNIAAYLDVNADEVTAGKMPTAVLYENVSEVSNRVLAQTITTAYNSDITWINEINGESDLASGSRIYEITPSKPGELIATIGTATNPQFIVTVKATVASDSLEFGWCISEVRTGREIECRTRQNGEAPIGTLRGLATGNPSGNDVPTTPVVEGGIDLSKLSNDQLLKLITEASKVLANR